MQPTTRVTPSGGKHKPLDRPKASRRGKGKAKGKDGNGTGKSSGKGKSWQEYPDYFPHMCQNWGDNGHKAAQRGKEEEGGAARKVSMASRKTGSRSRDRAGSRGDRLVCG